MLNRAKYKTRLTQNKKTKHISNAYSKTRRGERKREQRTENREVIEEREDRRELRLR